MSGTRSGPQNPYVGWDAYKVYKEAGKAGKRVVAERQAENEKKREEAERKR